MITLSPKIYFIIKILMDSLLFSRMKKDVSPTKLSNLSPDKYGKAAWAELTYTPSKLADNVIYREATTLRKTQEGTSKLREFQALNGFMKERLTQLELQRDGIEKSLSQQVTMYKKMLHDSEYKHEQRLKQIQKRFSSEINMLIQQKEEEAKFSQAEKEMLQGKIAELQMVVKETEEREANLQNDYNALSSKQDKLLIDNANYRQKLSNSQRERMLEQEQAKRRQDDMQRQYSQTENILQQKIESILQQKVKEKESMERLMKNQTQKIQNIRMNQGLRKSQELRDVMLTFQSETKRLNEIIAMKDRILQTLTVENTKAKQNILQITKHYQNRLNGLVNDRNGLAEQVERNLLQISHLQTALDCQMSGRQTDRKQLQTYINKMKEELQMNQVSFLRERDRFDYMGADLEKQLMRLRNQNMRMGQVMANNQRLSIQLRNLRDLLVQSSFQIERSKEQLMRMAFERQNIAVAVKAEKSIQQNQRIYRLNRNLEQENYKFRNTLYSQRTNFR